MAYLMRIVGLLGAVAMLGAVAGCGGNAGPASGTASPAPASSSPSTNAPTTSAPPTPSSTGAISGRPHPASVTLTGKVKDGVEAGCLVLEATSPSSGSYTLVGHGGALRSGQTVTVQGYPTDGMSVCQQGTLFEVQKVLKVSPSST